MVGGGGSYLKYFALGLLFENVLGLSSKDCQKKNVKLLCFTFYKQNRINEAFSMLKLNRFALSTDKSFLNFLKSEGK